MDSWTGPGIPSPMFFRPHGLTKLPSSTTSIFYSKISLSQSLPGTIFVLMTTFYFDRGICSISVERWNETQRNETQSMIDAVQLSKIKCQVFFLSFYVCRSVCLSDIQLVLLLEFHRSLLTQIDFVFNDNFSPNKNELEISTDDRWMLSSMSSDR